MLYALGLLSFLLITSTIFLQFSNVQEHLLRSFIADLSQKSCYPIKIEAMNIDLWDLSNISHIQVFDLNQNLMLSFDDVEIDFNLIDLFRKGSFSLEHIDFDKIRINLRRNKESGVINLQSFLAALRSDDKDIQSEQILHIGSAAFKDLQLNWNDHVLTQQRLFSSPLCLNINDLKLIDIMASADSIGFYMERLKADSSIVSSSSISDFNGFFGFTRDQVDLAGIHLKCGETEINSEVNLRLIHGDWTSFNKDSVFIEMTLSPSLIDTKDLNIELKKHLKDRKSISIEMQMEGYLNDLQLSSLSGIFESGSLLKARGRINGMGDVDSAILTLDLLDSYWVQEDIRGYLKDYHYGPLRFAGRIQGNKDEMLIKGKAINEYGNIGLDLNAMDLSSPENISYRGKVDFDDFQLGKILDDSRLGKGRGRLKFQGSGINSHTMNSNLLIQLENFIFLNKAYQNIGLVLKKEPDNYQFSFSSDDKDLKMAGEGVYLHQKSPQLEADIVINYANLKAMNFSEDTSVLSLNAKINIKDIQNSSLIGNFVLNDIQTLNKGERMIFDPVYISIDTIEAERVKIENSSFTLSASGNFPIYTVISDMISEARFYKNQLIFNEKNLRQPPLSTYEIKVKAALEDMGPIGRLTKMDQVLGGSLSIDLAYQKGLSFSGNISTELFQLDTFKFLNNQMAFDLETNGSNHIVGEVILSSKKQKWPRLSETSDLNISLGLNSDTLTGDIRMAQPSKNSSLSLNTQSIFGRDEITIKFLTSELKWLDKIWKINKENQIIISKEQLWLKNIEISGDLDFIGLEGVISHDQSSELYFEIAHFDLQNLASVLPHKWEGILSSKGKIERLGVEQPWHIDGQLNILGFQFEEVGIGDLEGVIDWRPRENGLYTDIKIRSDSIEKGRFFGYVFPTNQENQIDLNAEFKEMRINWLAPLFQKKISGVDGYASGKLRIQGPIFNPKVNGQATLSKGIATVDYLNTDYKFSGITQFDQNIIYFDQIEIFDRFGSQGFITGQVTHENMKGKTLDAKVDFLNLELLNTSGNQNTLYYGNAFGSGDVRINGPFNNLIFDVNIQTDEKTRLKIPIEDQMNYRKTRLYCFRATIKCH